MYLEHEFGFIKRVDEGWITTVKDLESWRFEVSPLSVALTKSQRSKRQVSKSFTVVIQPS